MVVRDDGDGDRTEKIGAKILYTELQACVWCLETLHQHEGSEEVLKHKFSGLEELRHFFPRIMFSVRIPTPYQDVRVVMPYK